MGIVGAELSGWSTPMFGRELELAAVCQLILSGQHRLVTLTGAGGSGKTRLALQAAAEAVEEYPDGVWFVSLATVHDARLIEPTIAQVLGARDEVSDFLRGKKLLLLLDNLEQLLPDGARIVASLEPHVLATSRERLNVSGEQEYPVPPLPTHEAVALFVQRAVAVKPDFELNLGNSSSVTEIVSSVCFDMSMPAALLAFFTSTGIQVFPSGSAPAKRDDVR